MADAHSYSADEAGGKPNSPKPDVIQGARAKLDMLAELRRQCDAAGGQAAWGRKHSYSSNYVSQVLRCVFPLTEGVVNAMGYVRQDRYVRWGA